MIYAFKILKSILFEQNVVATVLLKHNFLLSYKCPPKSKLVLEGETIRKCASKPNNI